MDSGMGLSITGGSEEMAQSSGKDKGQTMRRDESGRTCVVSLIFSIFSRCP